MIPRLHVVSILNQKLTVKSDASEEMVVGVAESVSKRIQEVLDRTQSVSLLKAALLVCLNMAEEMEKLQKSEGSEDVEKAKAAQKVRDMIRVIDSQLVEESSVVL